MDIVGVGVDPVDPADTLSPDAPPAPTLTPVAGGLLVDWTAFAGSDIAGYKVYYKDSGFTDLTAFTADTIGTLHDSLMRLSLDEFSPQEWWVAVSAVDLSGNESVISPVLSATPLPSAGSQPPVWIDLDTATALLNQPIGMTATGADNYDWDLDGDGVFDVLGDATGTQNINTSSPGIIRPLVRGNSSGGSFVSLSAVSVIVTSNARPAVQAFVDPAFGVAPLTVQFTSNQSDFDGEIVEYIWDFTSNGSVSWRYSTAGGSVNPGTYVFNTPGLYNAKVRVWDDDGAWDVDTVSVLVEPAQRPVAILTATPPDGEKGVTVFFDASDSYDPVGGIANYEWDLNDNGLLNEAGAEADAQGLDHVQVIFPDPGKYLAVCRITNDAAPPVQSATSVEVTVHGWATVLIDESGQTGFDPSLQVVDGNPAIAYFNFSDSSLKYVRATTITGGKATDWQQVFTVDNSGSVGYNPSLAIVEGNPAISYGNLSNGDLMYARATTSTGNDPGDWSDIVTVHAINNVGQHTSLAVVEGTPAISYYDESNGNLMYARSSTSTGTSASDWTQFAIVHSPWNSGIDTTLLVVDGHPAISYCDETNDDLYYCRADTTTGSTTGEWGSNILVESTGFTGHRSSMAIVAGYPAISYRGDVGDLRYARASTPTGGSALDWTQIIIIPNGGNVSEETSLSIIGGYPMISYYDQTTNQIKLVKSQTITGSDPGDWTDPYTVDSGGSNRMGTSLVEIDGCPAIAYGDGTPKDLKYAIYF